MSYEEIELYLRDIADILKDISITIKMLIPNSTKEVKQKTLDSNSLFDKVTKALTKYNGLIEITEYDSYILVESTGWIDDIHSFSQTCKSFNGKWNKENKSWKIPK